MATSRNGSINPEPSAAISGAEAQGMRPHLSLIPQLTTTTTTQATPPPQLSIKPAMGASPSAILNQPLFALPKPVAAINSCFCSPTPVTLHLREKAWSFSGDDFTIRDVHSGQLYFRIEGSALSMTDRKVLLDVYNQPIVHMRDEIFSFMPTFNISSDYDSRNIIFRIKAKATFFDTVLECKFPNVGTGRECRLGLFGDWRARAAVIWLDQGNGQKLPVARIYRPTATSRNVFLNAQDYYLDIAPNVDMALMVLVCVALDEAKKD
jgi:uncharacterized protein YxjI